MKCHIYAEDRINAWQEGTPIKTKCKSQHDVLVFDPDSGTYCCELTPSYYMEPVYSTFHLKADESDEVLEELDEQLLEYPATDCYIHCSTIDALPHFKDTRELPAELPHAFVLEWDEDEDAESLEDFIDNLQGNPPL